jgi:hypothetical protein
MRVSAGVGVAAFETEAAQQAAARVLREISARRGHE